MDKQTLQDITGTTLGHYQQNAQSFWAGTQEHDVSQNIEAMLRHIQAPAPYTLLDLGCGPGRDLATFSERGHKAIGLDGCPEFVEMARRHSGCEVWQQNLLALQLPPQYFDGIFANAVLFHVPTQELPRVMRELHNALKPSGVLFGSNPHGDNQEGWSGQRYGAYHDLETWRHVMKEAGFEELEHYYRPAGLPRAQQPWLASVWRRC